MHGVLLALSLAGWIACVHTQRSHRKRGGGTNVFFVLAFTVPMFLMAFSMLIILCVCAGEDKTQEVNMNIVMLTFAGCSCLTTGLSLCCVQQCLKQGLAKEQGRPALPKQQVAPAEVLVAPQSRTLQVQVPFGAAQGAILQVQTPEGLVIQVPVPARVSPGAVFMAQYTAPASSTLPPAGGPGPTRALSTRSAKIQGLRRALAHNDIFTVLMWLWLLALIVLSAVKSPVATIGDVSARRVWFGSGGSATVTASAAQSSSPVANVHEAPMSPPLGGGKALWRAPKEALSAQLAVAFHGPAARVVMLTLQQDTAAPQMSFQLVGGNESASGPWHTLASGTLLKATGSGFYDLYIPSTGKWKWLTLKFAKTSATQSAIGLNELNVFTGAGDPADELL
jgi:hypothetical protein